MVTLFHFHAYTQQQQIRAAYRWSMIKTGSHFLNVHSLIFIALEMFIVYVSLSPSLSGPVSACVSVNVLSRQWNMAIARWRQQKQQQQQPALAEAILTSRPVRNLYTYQCYTNTRTAWATKPHKTMGRFCGPCTHTHTRARKLTANNQRDKVKKLLHTFVWWTFGKIEGKVRCLCAMPCTIYTTYINMRHIVQYSEMILLSERCEWHIIWTIYVFGTIFCMCVLCVFVFVFVLQHTKPLFSVWYRRATVIYSHLMHARNLFVCARLYMFMFIHRCRTMLLLSPCVLCALWCCCFCWCSL